MSSRVCNILYIKSHLSNLQNESNLNFSYVSFYSSRTLKRRPMTGSVFIQVQRRKYQKKLIMMTAATISAFLFSWSPYTFVSLMATFKGRHVMTSGEAEIPELLAKASVIFNPFVYTFTNDTFRHTLWGIVNGNRGNVSPVGHSRNEAATDMGSVNVGS